MTAIRLHTKSVEKPWGRTDLPAIFDTGNRQIGEIWFDGPEGRHPPLLVKYLFTSEKLSIQVHPTDAQARASGLPGGKSECWYVLGAEPDAVLGIGTMQPLDDVALRAAALDGSIEGLMDWKPVRPGSFYYIPAGTVHAIGGGVTLVEVQMNNDVTYRLYDYGRPRELHLDDGIAVSRAEPYPLSDRTTPLGRSERLLEGEDKPFTLDLVAWEAGRTIALPAGQSWFIPIHGHGTIDGAEWHSSECWLVEGGASVTVGMDTTGLIATL